MAGRILVIRGGAFGDFILTLPAIRLLRENFPDAHIEILGYQHIISLADGRYYAAATRSIEYGAMAGFFIPHSELAPDLVEYFASFHQIISYLFDPEGFFESNLRRAGAKNILSAFGRIDDSDHAARQLARPLQSLALFIEDAAATVHLTEEDHAFSARFLAECDERPLIALHPGSGSPRKNWPIEKWTELGQALDRLGVQSLIVGGEADEDRVAALCEAWCDRPVLVARHLPLPRLAAILARSRLFLGHDSGISHLAAAAGARCVLLFGPTDPSVWAPLNPGVHVLQAPDGDLAKLAVEVVAGEVSRRI
ncbi:MAG: glycosyltransferase family 9 protein [Chthoniobacteraceae bacterium]